ncbi:MAG: hypothetical protein JOY57_04770 [Actinobacteria bacterium]|nr:hypothetical protein [Actinomycetota bacterium]
MPIRIDDSLDHIDWHQAKADLAADHFDNGRTPDALRRSFERSPHVVFARDDERVVGMAGCCPTASATHTSSTSGRWARTADEASPRRWSAI